jgi:recombinational DNA repair protein RecR
MRPLETRCHSCGTVAAETVCHLCKEPRLFVVNDYANAGIKTEKIDRAEGRYGPAPTLSELRRGLA